MSGEQRLGPGAVLALSEEDYCYGRGVLVMRVKVLGADPASFRRLEWVRIVGSEVLWDVDGEDRDVMVRVTAIPRSLRPARWRPDRCVNWHPER